jgi:hypothetical protein
VGSTVFKTAGRHPWRCRRTDRSRRAPAIFEYEPDNRSSGLTPHHWPVFNDKHPFCSNACSNAVYQTATRSASGGTLSEDMRLTFGSIQLRSSYSGGNQRRIGEKASAIDQYLASSGPRSADHHGLSDSSGGIKLRSEVATTDTCQTWELDSGDYRERTPRLWQTSVTQVAGR